MPKLQRIKRANGSLVFSVNIPLELIEEIGWEKGIELKLESKKVRGIPVLLLYTEDNQSVPELEKVQVPEEEKKG